MYDDVSPFRKVWDKNEVAAKVTTTESIIKKVKKTADTNSPVKELRDTKNIEIKAIIVGNLPLQGTRLLVSSASIRSLLESIILQPTTPAALQPKPIHIHRCF